MTRIDRASKRINVRDLKSGKVTQEAYDTLVLATGARPIRPPPPGIDLPGIHVLRTIPDSRKLKEAVAQAKRAVLVGGGIIGLEMADQVLPPLDPEMAFYAAERLRKEGVTLRLSEGVTGFAESPSGLTVRTLKGQTISADLVIPGMSVRPKTSLAVECDLELGDFGGIRVDECMRTSDPAIWAVGDVVEVNNRITRELQLVPLAGPANRQGRVAATQIMRGFGSPSDGSLPTMIFDGILGTSMCEVFGLTAAMTGASEKALRLSAPDHFRAVYLHPGHHARSFPDAKPIHMKLLFSTLDGRVLGAQAVGEAEVARRIDVISAAMKQGATAYDPEELDLCYAPQFGAVKDPVNTAGMIAANHLRGDLPLADWEELENTEALLVDVRSEVEYARGHIPNSQNLPLESLRERLHELPGEREIWLICGVGQRAYYAIRLLMQSGFQAKVLSGGMQTYQARRRSFEE